MIWGSEDKWRKSDSILPFVVNVKLKTYLLTSRQDRRYCSNCSNLIRFTWIVRVNVKLRMNETIFLLSEMSTANWSHAINKSPVDFRKSLIRDFERRDKVLHPATRNTKHVWLHSSVGRASHRYRGGHGFESRWSPDIFFSGFFFPIA